MEQDYYLSLYCKASDFDAVTGTCAAPFYGPVPSLVPKLDLAEGLQVSAFIVSCWAIGYYIRSARRAAGT